MVTYKSIVNEYDGVGIKGIPTSRFWAYIGLAEINVEAKEHRLGFKR